MCHRVWVRVVCQGVVGGKGVLGFLLILTSWGGIR